MKKVILGIIVFGAFYTFIYAPKQFKKNCLEQGGSYDSSTGNCKIVIGSTFDKEEWDNMVNEIREKAKQKN